jgi:hypothetical protein
MPHQAICKSMDAFPVSNNFTQTFYFTQESNQADVKAMTGTKQR